MRHERVDFLRHAHALLNRAGHANQTNPVLVLHQFTNGAHAAIAQVIDIVNRTTTVLELD